ncbi:hypothetical protein [Achromobacter xylosoxidans]|uniref:hypothetical protein n=1 Tax=Alcaligenes xylosoxydans xylosoxydans TaxID=85698 RepID=UPI001177BB80|nr:hypothetical protein [Achromobacter xylosoxidans]
MSSITEINSSILATLRSGNNYAALALALTMPDICSYAEAGKSVNGRMYAAWFDKWVGQKYTRQIGPQRHSHTFLHGDDVYALRCSFLHQGQADISMQRAQKALSSFEFVVVPSDNFSIHCNQSDDRLQLQLDIFCQDICTGVNAWSQAFESEKSVHDRAHSLLSIQAFDPANGIVIGRRAPT